MPRPKRYNRKDIEVMRAMRGSGFGYDEIQAAFDYDVPMSTIIYFAKDVEVRKDGKRELLRWVRDVAANLQPGQPVVQPPLPAGLIARLTTPSEVEK